MSSALIRTGVSPTVLALWLCGISGAGEPLPQTTTLSRLDLNGSCSHSNIREASGTVLDWPSQGGPVPGTGKSWRPGGEKGRSKHKPFFAFYPFRFTCHLFLRARLRCILPLAPLQPLSLTRLVTLPPLMPHRPARLARPVPPPPYCLSFLKADGQSPCRKSFPHPK